MLSNTLLKALIITVFSKVSGTEYLAAESVLTDSYSAKAPCETPEKVEIFLSGLFLWPMITSAERYEPFVVTLQYRLNNS